WIVVDPDSRMTQIGVLPIAPDAQTHYFPSRTIEREGQERLAELATGWAQALVGAERPPAPTIWLETVGRDWAAAVRAALAAHAPRWAVLNFGVGGNASKRVGAELEIELLRHLLDLGLGVLLSRGVDSVEVEATDALTTRLTADGVDVAAIGTEGDLGALASPGRRQ